VNSRNRYEERLTDFLEFVRLCAFFTAPCAIAVVLAQAPEQGRKGERERRYAANSVLRIASLEVLLGKQFAMLGKVCGARMSGTIF
jgi:hypothetical protein